MVRKPVRCWLSHSWSPPSVEKLCLPSSTTALEVPLAAVGFLPRGCWNDAPRWYLSNGPGQGRPPPWQRY